jgi:Tfp pilus assembly protein FimV
MFAKLIAAITRIREDEAPAVVELGQACLRSALGRPLMIDVPLLNAANIDLTKLRIAVDGIGRMRDGEAADNRSSLAITPALRKADDGQYFIRFAGRRPILQPFINLQVTLDGSTGKISREYDLHLPVAERETPADGATEPAPVASAVEPAKTISPDPAAPPSPNGRESQPMNPPDRRSAEQAWLDEQIARLQRVVTRLQRIAVRHGRMRALQVFEATRQRRLIERIDSQALIVIGATRAAQQKLEEQARQLDALQASIAALSKDFDLPADDPDADSLSAPARSAS